MSLISVLHLVDKCGDRGASWISITTQHGLPKTGDSDTLLCHDLRVASPMPSEESARRVIKALRPKPHVATREWNSPPR